MKVLVIGSGGREHALCRALSASPEIDRLYAAPGSAAIAKDATLVPIAVDDLDGLLAFCREEAIELVMPALSCRWFWGSRTGWKRPASNASARVRLLHASRAPRPS